MAQAGGKNTKKAVTKKTTSNKKKTTAKKSTKKKPNKSGLKSLIEKKEFSATITFVVGLLLLFVALFQGGQGSFWNGLHVFYLKVFGFCGYYIPLVVLFFGVVALLNKQNNTHFIKAGELFIGFTLICSIMFVSHIEDTTITFSDGLNIIFSSEADSSFAAIMNGGVLGAVVGGGIFQMCKSVALANIILIVLLVADFMLLFGISLAKVVMKMEKPAKKAAEITEDAIEKSKSELSRRKHEREERGEYSERHLSGVNPVKIIKDFWSTSSNNDDVEEVVEDDVSSDKVHSDRENNGVVISFTPVVGEEIADSSAASEASQTNVAVSTANSSSSNVFSDSSAEEGSIFDFLEFDSDEDAVVDDTFEDVEAVSVPSEKKKATVQPLSAKEEEALRESLDNAVAACVAPVQYVLPPLDCLKMPKIGASTYNEAELKSNGDRLIAALNSFNVSASIVGVVPGPSVTRYELSPAPGVKISKFVGLADDLALHMAAPAGLRIEAPIPNKAAIGIEIPNKNKTTVTFRETIDNEKFKSSGSKLTVALGKDISGTPMFSNLAKMPHLLVAGTTGSGKSVCLNSMIVSILYNANPDEVKLLLIDPKQVEFGIYNGLPHLLVPVVSDPRKAAGALGWAVTEMLSRYKTLNANGVRDIAAYNSLCEEREDLVKLPQIVIFIDELADLMTVAPSEVEDSIQRLAQMARAAGMHLVVATQRPSVDVITGVIKSNIPSRIALTVKSYVDSKIIIDTGGAEKLMGNGDMLYYPVGVPKPVRIQGCYLSDAEIENVVQFIKANCSSNYDDTVQQEIDRQAVSEKKKSEETSSGGIDSNDDLLTRAIELFVSAPDKASISALQRHLGLGFAKAGRLMDTLEQKGIVGPHMGSKPRNVLITKAQWYEMNAMGSDSAVSSDDSLVSTDSETE